MSEESRVGRAATEAEVAVSSEVVFLLGAGASVAAGVPDTVKFVMDFVEDTRAKNEEQVATLERVLAVLEKFSDPEPVDVELLLRTLTELQNKEKDVLLRFYEGGRFILSGASEKKPLIDGLKEYIRQRVVVSAEDAKYMQPMRYFVEEAGTLDILSANYDICVEQFCSANKFVCRDGFDVHWNPRTFGERADVRLYKLHGSIMWYQTDRGDYVKLPVKVEHDRVQMLTGESAESLIVYPMEKWAYAEPLIELLVRAKNLLESDTCRFLIAVGYTFRDAHIKRMIWDAARKNKALTMVLVDPKAAELYHGTLEFYDDNHTIESSLAGRVVCLPYCFEKVLPFLKLGIVDNLREGLAQESTAHTSERQGQYADWLRAFRSLIYAEHVTEAVSVFENRVSFADLGSRDNSNLELPFRLTRSLCRVGRATDGNRYARLFHDMLVQALRYQLQQLTVYTDRPDKPVMLQQYSQLVDPLRAIQGYVQNQARLGGASVPDDGVTALHRQVLSYMNAIPNGYIPMAAYITMREDAWPREVAALKELIGPLGANAEDLKKAVTDIERKELKHFADLEIPELGTQGS